MQHMQKIMQASADFHTPAVEKFVVCVTALLLAVLVFYFYYDGRKMISDIVTEIILYVISFAVTYISGSWLECSCLQVLNIYILQSA